MGHEGSHGIVEVVQHLREQPGTWPGGRERLHDALGAVRTPEAIAEVGRDAHGRTIPMAGQHTGRMSGWQWDPSLYAGSARYYAQGRGPYPPKPLHALVAELGLDGPRRPLDRGRGPRPPPPFLAPSVERATGPDAHAPMAARGGGP